MITITYVIVLITLTYLFGNANTAEYQRIVIRKDEDITRLQKQLQEQELRHIQEVNRIVNGNK